MERSSDPASSDDRSDVDSTDRPSDADSTNGGDSRANEVAAIAEDARGARESFEPPDDPDERAIEVLREGLWPVLEVYIDARGGGEPLSPAEASDLERALNDWLAVYARCYEVEMEPAFSVREAAEVFVQTHNVRDTAQLLTDVPNRAEERREE